MQITKALVCWLSWLLFFKPLPRNLKVCQVWSLGIFRCRSRHILYVSVDIRLRKCVCRHEFLCLLMLKYFKKRAELSEESERRGQSGQRPAWPARCSGSRPSGPPGTSPGAFRPSPLLGRASRGPRLPAPDSDVTVCAARQKQEVQPKQRSGSRERTSFLPPIGVPVGLGRRLRRAVWPCPTWRNTYST